MCWMFSKLMNRPELDRGLPVWIDENQDIHYELPLELSILTGKASYTRKLGLLQLDAYLLFMHIS
jgi:hypothetical protein